MSNKLLGKINFVFNQIKKGRFKTVFKGISRKIYSENISFVLKLDLTQELKKPLSFVKISVRLYEDSDEKYFLEDQENISLIKQLPKCYVAITEDGSPCYRQWIIDENQNKKIKEFWGNTYPQLNKGEVLMESAFTVPKYRGMGVMPLALYLIAEKSKKLGVKNLITITPEKNINSLRATHYMGFKPYLLQKSRCILFNKKTTYQELTEDFLAHYNSLTSRKKKLFKRMT